MPGLLDYGELIRRNTPKTLPGFIPNRPLGIGDPLDPLLLQVLPLGAELESPVGYTADPVGDLAAEKSAGLCGANFEGKTERMRMRTLTTWILRAMRPR